jgi:hypothetical protein
VHSGVAIEQGANHPLVLHSISLGFAAEEVDAAPRENDRHLLIVLALHEFWGWRQEILDDLDTAKWLIAALEFACSWTFLRFRQ